MVPFLFNTRVKHNASMKNLTLNRSYLPLLCAVLTAVFVMWGGDAVLGAGQGDGPLLTSDGNGTDDVIRSTDLDGIDDVQTIHPWDNNDLSDTTTLSDPGSARRHPKGTIETGGKVLDGPRLDKRGSDVIRPDRVALLRNYPNPFNAQTRIEFALSQSGKASLEIYNLLGQVVQQVVWNHLDAGTHSYLWNGHSKQGVEVPSGVYFYRLEALETSAINKMVLLK
jgi:hypothetical protein